MTFRPLHDRVLVRRVEEVTKTAGHFIISNTAFRKNHQKALSSLSAAVHVLKTAPSHRLTVSVKDKVLFGKWSGTEITLDGEELLIMKESDTFSALSANSIKYRETEKWQKM